MYNVYVINGETSAAIGKGVSCLLSLRINSIPINL